MNSLIWILLFGFGFWWLYRMSQKGNSGSHEMSGGGGCCGGGHQHQESHDHSPHSSEHSGSGSKKTGEISEMIVDPVCNMAIEKAGAGYSVDYDGKKFYFCSQKCYEEFKTDPEKHLLKEPLSN